MNPSSTVDVDPRDLRVPSSRSSGADLFKLHRQMARYGASSVGMPLVWARQASDGVLVIIDGVTRATRIAKLAPGSLISVEIVGTIPRPCSHLPKIGDLLP